MKEPLVFVVDDDAAVRGSLGLLLKSTGHPAATYESAQQFLGVLPGCATWLSAAGYSHARPEWPGPAV